MTSIARAQLIARIIAAYLKGDAETRAAILAALRAAVGE